MDVRRQQNEKSALKRKKMRRKIKQLTIYSIITTIVLIALFIYLIINNINKKDDKAESDSGENSIFSQINTSDNENFISAETTGQIPETTKETETEAAITEKEETTSTKREPVTTEDQTILTKQELITTAQIEVTAGDWNTILVNAKNILPDDFSPELKKLANGLEFDKRAIESLNKMLTAAKEEGLSPIVCSAYRSVSRQKELFEKQVQKQKNNGYNDTQADIEARKVVAYPGTSEHNTGLAADIVAESYQLLDEHQENTDEMKWLIAHCSEYGFILRYPKDKTSVTGIIYEPWHFRYVGIEAATHIMENGLCLEEYIQQIQQ